MKTTVVDYGAGNLRSIMTALCRADADPEVASDPDAVRRAERVVLPGVGAAGAAVESLRERGLVEALDAFRASGRPFLGICVGMQLLADELLEFGSYRGLGWIRGVVDQIGAGDGDKGVRVPHMGWSEIALTDRQSPLLGTSRRDRFFYFCHSYRLVGDDGVAVASVTHGTSFTCAVAFDNVFACQFHPEKSHVAGQKLLERFLEWAP
jgi:glutamine amidotransferase